MTTLESLPRPPSPEPNDAGLTTDEAARLLRIHGPNRLVPERHHPALIQWLLRPLADPMVVLLLVAGTTYLALGDTFDAIVILVAVIPITLVSFLLEARAEHA